MSGGASMVWMVPDADWTASSVTGVVWTLSFGYRMVSSVTGVVWILWCVR